MKINAISSINYNTKNNSKAQSFKHTAVPYPEFEQYYNKNQTSILDRISAFFHPVVTNEAKEIKSQIDTIYTAGKQTQNGKSPLLCVLA